MRIIILLSALFISCNSTTKNVEPKIVEKPSAAHCFVKRATFDIGSGETRLNVSKVDTCKGRIVATELEMSEKVAYKESMSSRRSKYLSQEIMQEGFKVLQKMKQEAERFKPQDYLAVATAAFREARNAEAYINEVNKALKINARIVSQSEEAIIGYYAALSQLNEKQRSLVVWDIGGSSQQIVYKDGDHFNIHEDSLASVSFKDRVLREIKNQEKARSPNPLSKDEITKAIELAKAEADASVKTEIKQTLRQPETKVVGIGGVHYYSILKQAPHENGSKVTLEEVEKTIERLTDKPDSFFEDQKHVATTITNVALVYGYMKALGLKELEIKKVDLSHGLLIHPEFWN